MTTQIKTTLIRWNGILVCVLKTNLKNTYIVWSQSLRVHKFDTTWINPIRLWLWIVVVNLEHDITVSKWEGQRSEVSEKVRSQRSVRRSEVSEKVRSESNVSPRKVGPTNRQSSLKRIENRPSSHRPSSDDSFAGFEDRWLSWIKTAAIPMG